MEMRRETALIELRGVSRVYRGDGVETVALHPLDLAIVPGEFLCLSGPSGSGKTTLLNLLGCLDTPSSGEVRIAGAAVGALSRRQAARLRRERIGFIFQAHNLVPVLSAWENVEYPLLLTGIPAAKRRQRVLWALTEVGLAAHGAKRPGQLSGGEQQRVAVARAIVTRPAIVLADEPTASLDSATGEELVELLHGLNTAERTTFVFSSHDPRIVSRARRVIRLRDGRLIGDDVQPGGAPV